MARETRKKGDRRKEEGVREGGGMQRVKGRGKEWCVWPAYCLLACLSPLPPPLSFCSYFYLHLFYVVLVPRFVSVHLCTGEQVEQVGELKALQ